MNELRVVGPTTIDPRQILAIQEYLAGEAISGPILFSYDFNRAFLGLGNTQSIEDVEPGSAKNEDYPIIRRFVSGGASAHEPGSSHCFVVFKGIPYSRKTVSDKANYLRATTEKLAISLTDYLRELDLEVFLINRLQPKDNNIVKSRKDKYTRSMYLSDGKEVTSKLLAPFASRSRTYGRNNRRTIATSQFCLRLRDLEHPNKPILSMKGYGEEDIEQYVSNLGSIKSQFNTQIDLGKLTEQLALKISNNAKLVPFKLDLTKVDIPETWFPKGGTSNLGLCELKRGQVNSDEIKVELIY